MRSKWKALPGTRKPQYKWCMSPYGWHHVSPLERTWVKAALLFGRRCSELWYARNLGKSHRTHPVPSAPRQCAQQDGVSTAMADGHLWVIYWPSFQLGLCQWKGPDSYRKLDLTFSHGNAVQPQVRAFLGCVPTLLVNKERRLASVCVFMGRIQKPQKSPFVQETD